ncbi:MAG: hypothetical protein QOC63_4520 [Mycobacterium sp.]|nr:hypothetical protein [Mycobacterium sp.]
MSSGDDVRASADIRYCATWSTRYCQLYCRTISFNDLPKLRDGSARNYVFHRALSGSVNDSTGVDERMNQTPTHPRGRQRIRL